MTSSLCYFEDVVVDAAFETPGLTVTRTHVALFQALAGLPVEDTDMIPDLLPLCLSTGLGWRIAQPPLAVVAFMGIEWRIVRPARVGDTIRSRSRSVVKRGMREGGVVIEERVILDQRDEIVHEGRFTFLVAKRPPAPAS